MKFFYFVDFRSDPDPDPDQNDNRTDPKHSKAFSRLSDFFFNVKCAIQNQTGQEISVIFNNLHVLQLFRVFSSLKKLTTVNEYNKCTIMHTPNNKYNIHM